MAFGVRSVEARGTRRDPRAATREPAPATAAALRGLSALWNLAALNVLWLLCCLPVVTAPLATCAAFGAVDRWARLGEDRVVRTFFELLRSGVRRASLACGLPMAVGAAGVAEALFFARRTGGVDRVCFGLGVGFAAACLLTLGYVLLLSAASPELAPRQVWELAGRLGLRNLPVTGPLFALEAIGAVAVALAEPALGAIVLPMALLGLVHRTALFGLRRASAPVTSSGPRAGLDGR